MQDIPIHNRSPLQRIILTLRYEGLAGAVIRPLLYLLLAWANVFEFVARMMPAGEGDASIERASWLREIVFTVRIKLNLVRERKRGGPRLFRELNFQSRKRSDTVFILGSGGSINELGFEQWREIEEHDSIGFNFWIVHDFVPGMVFFENNRNHPARQEAFRRLLILKQKPYANVPFVQFTQEPGAPEGFPELLMPNLYLLCASRGNNTLRGIQRSLKLGRVLDRSANLRFETVINPGPQLGMIAMLCVLAGYKRIVLLGVDLLDTRYFWEVEPEKYDGIPTPPNIHSRSVHETFDREGKMIPIDVFLTRMQNELRPKRDFEIFCGSSSSALADIFPVFQFSSSQKEKAE
jgi:hypothetical protein